MEKEIGYIADIVSLTKRLSLASMQFHKIFNYGFSIYLQFNFISTSLTNVHITGIRCQQFEIISYDVYLIR